MKRKKLSAIILATILFILASAGLTTSSVGAASFKDVPKTHWSYESVGVMSNKGVVKGYGDGTFKPNQPVTRAHSAMFLARALKLDTTKEKPSPYKDIKPKTSGYNEIVALHQLGVFASADKFNPSSNLTRAQMAKIIVESYNLKPKSSAKRFTDVSYSHWAYDYINTIASYQITSGATASKYKPNSPVTRAQMVAFLHRTEEAIEKDSSIVKRSPTTSPEPSNPEPSNPEPSNPEPSNPEPSNPEPSNPEPSNPEPSNPEPSNPEPSNPEPSNPEPSNPEPSNPEPSNPEPNDGVIDTTRNYSQHEDIQKAFEIALNEYRASLGLNPVQIEPALTQMAGFRSWDMAENNYVNHDSPIYGNYQDILAVFRPHNNHASESILRYAIGAGATQDANNALAYLKSSPGHNNQLIADGVDKLGVGIHTRSNGVTTILTVILSYD